MGLRRCLLDYKWRPFEPQQAAALAHFAELVARDAAHVAAAAADSPKGGLSLPQKVSCKVFLLPIQGAIPLGDNVWGLQIGSAWDWDSLLGSCPTTVAIFFLGLAFVCPSISCFMTPRALRTGAKAACRLTSRRRHSASGRLGAGLAPAAQWRRLCGCHRYTDRNLCAASPHGSDKQLCGWLLQEC